MKVKQTHSVFSKTSLFLSALVAFAGMGCEQSAFEGTPNRCLDKKMRISSNLAKLREIDQSKSNLNSFKVALLGDPQGNPRYLDDAIQQINLRKTEFTFAFILGDLSDTGLPIEQDWVCTALNKLEIPFLAVLGNHDSLGGGKQLFQDIFGDFNYSFTFQKSKFIIYNDNKFEFENEEIPRMGWIASEATISTGEVRNHTIGVSHVPVNMVEAHDAAQISQMLRSFADSKIDLTVHGHRHDKFYDKDEYGNGHFVVSDTKGSVDSGGLAKWGTLTVFPNRVALEHCAGATCTTAVPQ